MNQKVYKNIAIFLIFWMVLFFISEYSLNLIFEDQTPIWKLLAVSLLSAVFLVYPILKNSKDFSLDHVRKRQKKTIANHADINVDQINSILVKLLKENGFKITSNDKYCINFKSKWNLNSFGERYQLTILQSEIIIESTPAFYKLPFDGGQVYKDINRLDLKVKSLINEDNGL